MIFRNHNNMLICCSRNISDYYQCWKQSCCTIFLWKPWYILFFRIHRWIESSKEQHLFKIEIFLYWHMRPCWIPALISHSFYRSDSTVVIISVFVSVLSALLWLSCCVCSHCLVCGRMPDPPPALGRQHQHNITSDSPHVHRLRDQHRYHTGLERNISVLKVKSDSFTSVYIQILMFQGYYS